MISAMIAFSVLLVIAIGTVSLSLSNVTISAQLREHNNAYYVAEAAVQKALQHIKNKIGKYYKEMLYIAQTYGYSTTYLAKYNGFFDNIKIDAQTTFLEPVFEDPSFTGATTTTIFSVENFNESTQTADMAAESTAILKDGTKRTVRGVLNIPRINVLVKGDSWFNPSTKAFTVGSELSLRKDFNDMIYIHNGNAEFGSILNKSDPFTNVVMLGGTYSEVPGLENTINNSLKYINLALYRETAYTYYVTDSSGPAQEDVSVEPSYVEGAPGLSYTLSDINMTGQVYSNGDLTISRCIINGDIYCDGNLNISRCTILGNIFCAGNVTLYDSIFSGELEVNTTVDGALYAGGTLNFDRSSINNGIIYASGDLFIKFSAITGVVFCGRTTELHNDLIMTGSLTTKKNFTFTNNGNRSLDITYNSTLIDNIKNNEMYQMFFNGYDYVIQDMNADDTINSEKIYAK